MTRPIMPNETVIDPPEAVPGSWLRIIGRFTWSPRDTFEMERVASGTCYHAETPTKVREILETYAANGRGTRLRVHYGDVETGRDWLDEHDVEGYIGTTTGPLRSPLIVSRANALGGSTILDQCIVRIRFASRAVGGDLYRHPKYHVDEAQARSSFPHDYDKVIARHFA